MIKQGTPRPDARVLEPYIPFIDETLERYPRLVCTRICDMLRGRGYTGSLRTLRRYVRVSRPQPKSEVFLRVETLPGEQAQVDWGHVGTLVVDGGQRPSGHSSWFSCIRARSGRSSSSASISIRLLTLPDPLPSTELVAPIAIDKTAFARLETNRYSVPSEFARRTVTLAASDDVTISRW